jgi:medium-chain acyl-[acyl-carrier-protein] hydrolase
MNMKNVYSEKITLRSSDVNMYRKLRTSRLFELLQEISIRHTEALGAGRAITLDKGILWVVTMQQVEIKRMPEFDEEINIQSWPGETMHVLFPRYYRILDADGRQMINASALWMLVDQHTRKYVFPETQGIKINGVITGNEIELPTPIAGAQTDQSFDFQVPFSYVDLNGHMNNTCYFDLAENEILTTAVHKPLKRICTEYMTEMRYREEVNIHWCKNENDSKFYICGSGDKNYFKMNIEYDEEK